MQDPIIKLEISEMRHTLLTHLGLHHERVETAVGEALASAVEHFDVRGEAERAAVPLLQEKIKGILASAISDLMSGEQVKERIKAVLREHITGTAETARHDEIDRIHDGIKLMVSCGTPRNTMIDALSRTFPAYEFQSYQQHDMRAWQYMHVAAGVIQIVFNRRGTP
jgi:hypothetical protein